MSQLNPNAAEFIPISPTRSIPSPACRAIINDEVISQSPKRPTANDIDISVPKPEEFEDEVKSRPHEVDTCSNGDDGQPLDDQHDISSKESMELFLNNGLDELKNVSTPTKLPASEEFHFGPNAAPFTPAKLLDQSEALSTKALFGDESVATIGTTTLNESGISEGTVDFSVLNKEQDPMNTSFYQDREGDKNPFDLNKVHVLPDDLDEFLNKPDEPSALNDTISDLPEHNPLSGIGNQILDNDEKIQITDLDKMMDDEKELASPISNDVCDFVDVHQRDNVDLLGGGGDTGFEKSPGVMSPERVISPELAASPKLVEPEQGMLSENTAHSPQPEISSTEHVACELKAHSPVPIEVTPQELIAQPSEITDMLVTNPVTSPGLSPEPTALSPEPTQGEALSPAPQYSPALSPEPSAPPYELDTKELIGGSQDMSEVKVPSPELVALSPEPLESHPEGTVISSEPRTMSPEPVEQTAVSPAPLLHEPVAPSPGTLSPELDALKPHSPEPTATSPEPTTASPEPTELSTEPVSEAVEAIEAASPEPVVEKYTQNFEAELIPSLNEEMSKSPEPLAAPSIHASVEPSEQIALSPEPVAQSPEPVARSPEPVAQSPELVAHSPEPVAHSPEVVAQSPEPVAQSPEPVAASPVPAAMSPEPVLSPKPVSISPEPRALSPQSTAISLEPQLISESPADALEDTLIQGTVASETQPEICSFSEKTFLETIKNEFSGVEKDTDEECLKKEHTFSPFEDVTSSVKDDVSSPVKDLSSPLSPDQNKTVEEAFAASPEPIVHTEVLSVQSGVPLQESSPLVEANQSFSGTESVATTEINSFLERSEVPDITSPLSPGQPPSHLDFEFSLPTQPVDIKTEHISREFAEPAIVTPSEESKQDDLSSSAPEDKKPEELKEEGISKEAVAVAAAAAATTAAAVAASATPAEKKAPAKPKSATIAAKKPAPKPLPMKAAPPKTSTTSRTTSSKPTTATTKTTTSAAKTTKTTTASPKPAVPKAAPKSPPKPKTTPSSTMAKTDKKPLMNGDVKTSSRTTSSYSARKIENVSKTETSKTAATKSPVTKTTTPSRPSTAPARTTTAQRASSTTAAPKPRPTTLTSRTTSATASKAATANKPTTKSPVNATAAKTTSTTAAAPKPRATTAPARGRVPLTKTTTKGPDTEKQNKDTANKLTASRTTTTSATSRTSAGRTVTSTLRKTETKGTTGARTITKTTTTTKPTTAGKKPTEIVRNIKTKTTTTKTESPKENGVTTATLIVAEETTVVINSEPALELLKDNSPLDNKLLIDNALTNTAD